MYSKEVIAVLKDELKKLIASEPFNGKITHRTRAPFIAKWKEILETKGISGAGYIDDLLHQLTH